MVNINPTHDWMSSAIYLIQENDQASGVRHEYVGGRMFAMVGAAHH